MRSTFKVLFYVNGSKEKNGVVPVMGRVTINGSVAQFSCFGTPRATGRKGKARRHGTSIWHWTISKPKSSSIINVCRIGRRL